MNRLLARPNMLKQANISLIRRAIKSSDTATRAEIAEQTNLSVTTVRSLLAEMMENREIESIGHDASSGGRKAERYRLNPGRYHSAVFCITDTQIHCLIVDVNGRIAETSQLEAAPGGEGYEDAITSFLDGLAPGLEIRSLGVGVPGVVEGGCYWRKERLGEEPRKYSLGDNLKARYDVPVILENDIKAIAIGYNRCYMSKFPDEDRESINMAYIHFENGCVSAGFIEGGNIIRGYGNYSGELGLVPFDGDRLLDECLSEQLEDREYVHVVAKIICWVCAILNPEYVALGGPGIRKQCISSICDEAYSFMPGHMLAQILYSPDVLHDYFDGMAYLTASRMFDDIQLIKY